MTQNPPPVQTGRMPRQIPFIIATTGLGVMAFQMYFFAAFAFIAALVFGWYSTRYRMVNNYRSDLTA